LHGLLDTHITSIQLLHLCKIVTRRSCFLSLGSSKDTDFSSRVVSISAGFREFYVLREQFKNKWVDEMRQRWIKNTSPHDLPGSAAATVVGNSSFRPVAPTSSTATSSSSHDASDSEESEASEHTESGEGGCSTSGSSGSSSSSSSIDSKNGSEEEYKNEHKSGDSSAFPVEVPLSETRPVFDQETQLAAGALMFALVEMCSSLKRVGTFLEKL